jgi:hypothetical protein
MIRVICALAMLTICSLTAGCYISGSGGRPEQIAATRAEIIDRLAPEEGTSRRRLAAVIKAMTTVMDIENERRFPLDIRAVRLELRKASLEQLRRIERMVPEIEREPVD